MNISEEKRPMKKGSLLTFRPDIKVLDCTIRDGGLVNKCNFSDDFVRAVYKSNIDAGVDYMEFGYKASRSMFPPGEYGPWRFCAEEDLRRIVGDNSTPLKISVMADVGRTNYREDIVPKENSVIDMVRVATYVHQLPEAVAMVNDAHDKGYETCINLMAVSLVKGEELDESLEILMNSKTDVIYLVDSFGSLYTEQIRDMSLKYLGFAEDKGKKVGIHAHNNQQLAFANTIEALTLGVSYLDSTINGLGRGAGNCQTELLLGFLKNPKYNLRPVLKCIQEQILPLKQQLSWGFDIPYMVTGQLNRHPSAAIKFSEDKNTDYTAFYDAVLDEF